MAWYDDPNTRAYQLPEAIAARGQAQAAADAQAKADADAKLSALRTQAATGAQNTARNYFTEQGVAPDPYYGAIDTRIGNILDTLAPDDPNAGQYLQGLGPDVFSSQQDATRARAGRDVNATFAPNFETQRIGDTADDPFLAGIDKKQRGSADAIIQNLLKRHVITDTGAAGAEKNLDEQGGRVRTQLDQLGGDVLASGRQTLTGIANKARSDAQTLDLGQTFNASDYGKEADAAYTDFFGKLGDTISSRVPGNLYDTSGLSATAGAVQGAQNTAFDPRALAGIIDNNQQNNITAPKRRPVF